MFELSTNYAVTDAELVLDLTICNGTAKTAYIPVLPPDGGRTVHPNSAYTCLSTDETAVCFLLGPSLLPPNRNVGYKATAYHVPLLAGKQMRHTLRFPLPVREWYAYSLPAPPTEGEVVVRVYQVHVLVHAVRKSRAAFVEPVHKHDGLFQVSGKKVDLLRQTLTPDLPLPVVKHPNPDFPRL